MISDFIEAGKTLIEAGFFKHWLKVIRPGGFGGTDDYGFPDKPEDGTGTVLWSGLGSIETMSSEELWEAQAAQSQATHRVILPHVPDMKPSDCITFDERIFHIEELINESEADVYTVALVKERA